MEGGGQVRREQQTCSAPGFSAGATSGGGKTVAQPTRHWPGHLKSGKCDLYGKEFPDSDAAFKAMAERGYCEPYYPRGSVLIETFDGLASERRRCAFDAAYRFYKWLGRRGANRTKLRDKLTVMAKGVGIFHPVARNWGKSFLNGREVAK